MFYELNIYNNFTNIVLFFTYWTCGELWMIKASVDN